MNKTSQLSAIFHIALPLIFNLLAFMAMQFVDVVMLGRLGALALAASALGNVVLVIILVGCIGTLTAVGTLAAEAFGDQNQKKVQIISQQGLWLVIFLSIPAMILIWNAHHLLLAIHQPFQVVVGAKQFLHGLFWGFLPEIGFITLREFTMAISRPKIVMWIGVCAIPLNAILNYWFMYGGLGLPSMKIFGVGLSTAIVSWLMFITLALYVTTHRTTYHYEIFKFTLPKFQYLKRILRLGFPVGLSFIIEEFLFVMTALLIGYFGVESLAAYQIAIQCMFVIVMIPIGLSQAAAIKVSQLLGAADRKSAFETAYLAIGSGLVIAFVAACILWTMPNFLVSLFIDVHSVVNQPIIALASKLLAIIAVFHILDACQIITGGALRGYQDTLIPLFLGLISFWLVGIGSGYIFGFVYKYGAVGLWWGLALGVSASAILLQWRLLTYKV